MADVMLCSKSPQHPSEGDSYKNNHALQHLYSSLSL